MQLLLSQKEQFEWSGGLQSESKPGQLELSAQPANIISFMIFQRHNIVLSTLYFFTSTNFLTMNKQDLEHIAGFDKTCKSRPQTRTQSPNQGMLCRSFREIFLEIVAAVETLDLNYHLKEAFYARFQPPPSSPTTLNADGFLADFPHFAVGIHKTTTDLLNLQHFISLCNAIYLIPFYLQVMLVIRLCGEVVIQCNVLI